jgi:hypothetical protein
MHILIIFIVMLALWIFIPGMKHIINWLIAPIVIGLAVGGVTWSLAAMFVGQLVSWQIFLTFIVISIVGSAFVINFKSNNSNETNQ